MADGKRRYKSDRKDYKISVKLSEKDMDILDAAVRKSGKTVSEYVRELILVLLWILPYVNELFDTIKNLFSL